ncbi:hypothetical protein BGZ82_003072, partial [Podila clonocystis]
MRHPASSFKDLDFLTDRLKTIIYFQHKGTLEQAGYYLRGLLGNDKDRVTVYHLSKSDPTKELWLKAFQENKFDILLSTEAAGMGCDIPDIVHVVQFGLPSNIASLLQRLGRAVRGKICKGSGSFWFQIHYTKMKSLP